MQKRTELSNLQLLVLIVRDENTLSLIVGLLAVGCCGCFGCWLCCLCSQSQFTVHRSSARGVRDLIRATYSTWNHAQQTKIKRRTEIIISSFDERSKLHMMYFKPPLILLSKNPNYAAPFLHPDHNSLLIRLLLSH